MFYNVKYKFDLFIRVKSQFQEFRSLQIIQTIYYKHISIYTIQFKMDDKQQKQAYLRDNILGQGYDPTEFVVFLNTKIPIGDNIDIVTLEQLQAVVTQFVAFKQQEANSFQPLGDVMGSAIEVPCYDQRSSYYKPKPLLFTKYNPNVLEAQFYKNFQCRKVVDSYAHFKVIKCMVSDPQRKSTGGVFGIGGTSFLQFKVQTFELGWKVHRRYSDFVWLRNYLLKAYPSHIIPPIPQKKAHKRTQRHITKRMKILQFFLNDLVSMREILNDRFVEGFLNLTDNVKFQSLKKQGDKVPPFTNIAQYHSFDGTVSSVLSEENKTFMDDMQKKVVEYQKLYKQITRRGKRLQQLITQEVNTLYQMGNMFADLHQLTRQTANKLPKCPGVTGINEIFISLNNMMIEWGNLTKNQHDFLEKNFNTFFKYVRNQFFGFTELIAKEQAIEAQYVKAKNSLEKKKEKIYSLHDPSKWQLSSKELSSLPKQIVHDKIEAFKVMLPTESNAVEKLKTNLFFYMNELYNHGNQSFMRNCIRYCQNFKQFAIKVKVNNQQLGQMWNQMSANFSGESKKLKVVKQIPVQQKVEEIYDDF